MLWMDRTGALLGMVGAPDSATPGNPHLSPDGRSVLFLRQVGVSAGSTWIMDTVTGAQRMFQDGGVGAIWSPGGDAVTFCIINNSGPLFVTRAANSAPGAPTAARGRPVVGYGNNCVFPEDISAGGHMVYRMGGYTLPPRGGDVMALPPNQGDPIPVAQAPAAAERNPRFSPDGNWIAYQSDESGRFEIYVQPFPGSAAQRQRVSLGGGTLPQWGRNGRELFFISGTDSRLMVAPAVATVNAEKRNIEFSTPKALFPSPLPQGSEYDVDRAGDRFLVIAPVEDSPPIVVLPNWVPAR
jgi:dipeptidyl aminopeptidase/acylaminoacyl peptidase